MVQNPKTTLISEEYSSITSLDKETEAKGLNEMNTDVEFSGTARYRAISTSPDESSEGGKGSKTVQIAEIELVDEWVKITNDKSLPFVDMTNWTLSDDDGHIYEFPDNFVLNPRSNVTVYTFHGTDSAKELYMNRDAPIWNNEGDCAILTDNKGELVDKKCEKCVGEESPSHEIDFDETYVGDYSIQRRVLFKGAPKYGQPHLSVSKNGTISQEVIFGDNEVTREGESPERFDIVADYTITVENDGNRALGPIRVQDFFPLGAEFLEASVRPSERTENSVNWTLTHLSIGDVAKIDLKLKVSENDLAQYVEREIVNRVRVCGGYGDDERVCASNFTANEIDWLTCCIDEIYDTFSVDLNAKLDANETNIVTYSIEIENKENSTRVATVTDGLPDGMKLLEASVSVPFASYENDVVSWNLVNIEPYETKTITYKVKASRPGMFVNQVRVDPRSLDGSVAQPVYANAVVNMLAEEPEYSYDGSEWQVPNWKFDNMVYQDMDDTCDCEIGDDVTHI